jgi:hypothetical protein
MFANLSKPMSHFFPKRMLQEKKKEFPEKKGGEEKKLILFPDPSRPTFLQA